MHGVMRALIARWVALIAMLGLLALVIGTSRTPCVPYGMWHTLQMNCRWDLRGDCVTARVIVAQHDGWLRFSQVGTIMPVDVAASKKTASVRVLGRKPHGLLNTNKIAGVLAPAVWTRSIEVVGHHTLYAGVWFEKST
jgi:hypothetical protein